MKNTKFKIGSKFIGLNHAPFIIAELSANHNGDIEQAKKLMEIAVDCGADAIKIQTYKPETMTIRSNKPILHIMLWNGRSLYDLYEAAQTPFEWQKNYLVMQRLKILRFFQLPLMKKPSIFSQNWVSSV